MVQQNRNDARLVEKTHPFPSEKYGDELVMKVVLFWNYLFDVTNHENNNNHSEMTHQDNLFYYKKIIVLKKRDDRERQSPLSHWSYFL